MMMNNAGATFYVYDIHTWSVLQKLYFILILMPKEVFFGFLRGALYNQQQHIAKNGDDGGFWRAMA